MTIIIPVWLIHVAAGAVGTVVVVGVIYFGLAVWVMSQLR